MKWYYHDGTNQVGPFEDVQIVELVKNGTVKHQTQVWKEGAPAWGQAATTELAQYFAQMPPPMIPPPPVFAPAPVQPQGYYPPPVQAHVKLVYPRQPPRDPRWMAFASAMILGLGQILLGQKAKGWTMLLGGFVLYQILGFILYGVFNGRLGHIVAGLILWIPSAIDAFKVAKRLRNGKPVGQWDFFPNPNE